MGANELLQGRRGQHVRGRRGRHAGEHAPRELRADPLIAHYEQGPYPATTVQPFPAGLVELWTRLTGRPFDAEAMATWERVRSYGGFVGVKLTPELEVARSLEDPIAAKRPPPVTAATTSKVEELRRRIDAPDPADLGDD